MGTAAGEPTESTVGGDASDTPRLWLSGAQKSYGSVVALRPSHIAVCDGEAVAIMGASGSGKSTLLHVMAGITTPDSGDVWLRRGTGAVNLAQLSDRDRSKLRLSEFGFVFQQGLLIPELTALENVCLPLLLLGESRASAIRASIAMLEELGLGTLGERRIGQLSGGQAQRVAIARAQVTGAGVVFADEPTGALDSVTAKAVLKLLLESTKQRGHVLIIVTHDEDVASQCSRIVRLRDGQIVDDVTASRR